MNTIQIQMLVTSGKDKGQWKAFPSADAKDQPTTAAEARLFMMAYRDAHPRLTLRAWTMQDEVLSCR